MRLDLGRIRTPHTVFDRVYPVEGFGGADEAYRVVEPVRLHLDIHKDGPRFRLDGRVQTMLELSCGRCLEPFLWPIDAAFDLNYHPQSDNTGEGEVEVGPEDLSAAFYENDEIDLGQLMREQFYLSLPMKPLCTPECKGLCAVCGTNLNRGACTCAREWEDPRLAGLKALTTKHTERGGE
jgi:uncharacterized protein